MMFRTHIALGAFLALIFLSYVENKIVFVSVLLICSLLPDIDSAHSYLGHKKIFRPLQWIVKHRSFIHSFSICIFLTALFALYLPVIALPFFLGYAGHLLADALTLEGIRPFWPSKNKIAGSIKTGGHFESILFWLIVAANILIAFWFFKMYFLFI